MTAPPRPLFCLPLIALLTIGCASDGSQKPSSALPSADLNVPPKQLVNDVRRAVESPPLSLPIVEQHDGTLVTGWQPFRGELHIVRYWEERTRYRITIFPDWNNPTGRSHLEVADETEQRAEQRQQWYPAPELHRPERAQAVLKQILQRLESRQ